MGVTGKDEVGAVGCHAIDDAKVRRMRDTQSKVGVSIEFSGDIVVTVASDVRVVDPSDIDMAPIDLESSSRVGEVEPSDIHQTVDEVLPREHVAIRLKTRWTHEVPGGVNGLWSVVVVATENECARHVEQRLESVEHVRYRKHVGQKVAGDDDGVGSKVAQGADPLLLAHLSRHEVQVGEVQNPHGRLPGRQQRGGRPSEHVVLGLPSGVRERGGPGSKSAHEGHGGGAHAPMLPRRCHTDRMSALKDRLQADLTTAIKQRDELSAATIRMVLTAITNEEVAGKEARQLSDEDVVTVLGREAKKRRESAEAYDQAQRPELAQRERDELGVITGYLPEQLGEAELETIVAAAVAEVAATGVTGGQAMGAVMKVVQPQIKGKADGGTVSALVKKSLGL